MSSDGTQESLALGSEFASYEIVRLLGEGDFGEVYESVKRPTGQRVALKVLRVEMQGNEEIIVRFMREARAVALLRHPNIVQAVEVGEHAGRPFLAMELLQGEPMSQLMAQGQRLPLGEALDIGIPLMAAVRTVHAQGIVHRDLKPDNVFITYTDDGVVCPKVLDFGFAKMAEPGLQLTGKDTAIGTPNFMSPEQMLSPRSVDPRSDQWALGVMLYYMLTGQKPFEGKNLAETLKNVLQREPADLRELCPELPPAVCAAVMRTMRKPPDQRFASVHDFAQALMPFASDATALLYAREFYTVSVWEALGEEAPSRESVEAPQRGPRKPRRSPSPSPRPSPQTPRPSPQTPRPPMLSRPVSSSRPSTPARAALPLRASSPSRPPPTASSPPVHRAPAVREEPAAPREAMPEMSFIVSRARRPAPIAIVGVLVFVIAVVAVVRLLF